MRLSPLGSLGHTASASTWQLATGGGGAGPQRGRGGLSNNARSHLYGSAAAAGGVFLAEEGWASGVVPPRIMFAP